MQFARVREPEPRPLPPPFATRLVPPRVPGATLRRPRVLARLHDNLSARATLVVGPAGYGKTTAMAQFASEAEAVTAWCTLDESDRDARVLLADLAAAVARQVPAFGQRVRRALRADADAGAEPGSDDAVQTAAALFVAELHEGVPDVLVLLMDDCQTVAGSAESSAVLDALLEHLPDHCHLVLGGRALPDLPSLSRLVARRQVSRLTQAALRLTAEESAELVRAAGLPDAGDEEVAALHAQTQGWPMAAALAAACAVEQGEPLGGLMREQGQRPRLPGAARDALFAFLAAEVLAQQPARLQSLLLESSVLPHLEVERCAALLERPAEEVRRLLAAAEARALFISRLEREPGGRDQAGDAAGVAPPAAAGARLPARPGPGWGDFGAAGAAPVEDPVHDRPRSPVYYRLHDLFRDFLRQTLREQQPTRWRWLERRAAGLAAAAGDLPEAVQHALAGRHGALAARLIVRAAPDCAAAGQWSTLRAWIGRLPDDAVWRSPELALVAARADYVAGAPLDLLERRLERLEAVAAPDSRVAAEARLLRAGVLRRQGRTAAAAACCREVLRNAAGDLPASAHAVHAQAYLQLAAAAQEAGDFEEARSLCAQAVASGRAGGDPVLGATALDAQAAAELNLGRLEAAVTSLREAQVVWRALGNESALARSLNNLADALRSQGDVDQARSCLEEAGRLAARTGAPLLEAYTWLGRGDLWRDGGDLERALEAYDAAMALAGTAHQPYLLRCGNDALAQTYRLLGRLDRAEALARQAVHEAERAGAPHERGTYLCTLALVHLDRLDHGAAQAALDAAVAPLRATRSRRELARAHLYRAQAALAARQRMAIRAEVAALGTLLADLGYHGFLLGDARRARPVLDYAAARGLGNRRVLALRDAAGAPSAPRAPGAPGTPAASVVPARSSTPRATTASRPASGPSPRRGAASPPGPGAEGGRPAYEALGLGATRVRRAGGEEVEWPTAKSKELLFYFLCNRDWQTRDQIASSVWVESSSAQARSNYHVNLHRLRAVLGADVVEEHRGRYRLCPDFGWWFDAEEFERRAGEAAGEAAGSGSATARLRHLEETLALYRGPFLSDLWPDWAEPRRRRLEAHYLGVAAALGRLYAGVGRYAEAVGLAQDILKVDPFLEPAHELLIACQAAAGHTEAALHHYRAYAQQLQQELGMAPPADLAELHRGLVRGDPPPALAARVARRIHLRSHHSRALPLRTAGALKSAL